MKVKREHKKNIFVIYLEYIPFLALYKLLRVLPFPFCMKTFPRLMPLLYWIDRKHAERSVHNIIHAGICDNRRDAAILARRSFREFGKLLIEIVKADQVPAARTLQRRGSKATWDYLDSCAPGKGQIILVTAHFGNWEMPANVFCEMMDTPMSSLMRPFSNPLIGKLILNHRGGSKHHLIDKHSGIRPVLKAMAAGHIIGILIDQHAAGSEGVECVFFGHPAKVHMTPALLHLKSGIPIIPEVTVRLDDEFHFAGDPADPIIYTPTGDKEKDIRKITQMCISALEEKIRQHPEQWLWAPRHWLDLDRREAEKYKNWQPPQE